MTPYAPPQDPFGNPEQDSPHWADRLGRRWAAKVALSLALTLSSGFPASSDSVPELRRGTFALSQDDRAYWAFQPLEPRAVPVGISAQGAANPVDAFVNDRLSVRRLTANPRADPREQVRRLWFDLLGLAPDRPVVAAFERDPSDVAWARLVDQCLASPRYGERWGRHWLDLVRYAESNGYERDGPKPNAWRYRDYVIRSFNQDKPYDQFIREQLAGDEIAGDSPSPSLEEAAWRDAIIATGFYRLHVWDDEPDSTVAAEYDDLDDILVTTGTAFLGITLGCARCHDHKFDPISQADYYSFLSFFRGLDPYGQHKTGGGGRGTGRIDRPLASTAALQQWQEQKRSRVEALQMRLKEAGDADRKALETELKAAESAPAPFDVALAAVEIGGRAKETHVLHRGDPQSPRERVSPAFPVVLGTPVPAIRDPGTGAGTSGRRRVLADWIASADNPLTARVLVNRVWQHHFGSGLVPTPDDFGRTGLRPTHPELLDFLAREFVMDGWSVKRLHRRILLSEAYRRSSDAHNPNALAEDEGNSLLWRQNLRRLEAEVIRDNLLLAAGELNCRSGGPSVYPTLPAEVHGTQDSAGKGWADSSAEDQKRRSVYLVVKRALKVPLLECLDFANSASPSGTRTVTTTAPQALMLLNDPFVHERAAALALRIESEASSRGADPVLRLYEIVLQRPPSASERTVAESLLASVPNRPGRAGLESLCRVLLNVNEFIYVE
ncbi:MAG: DUF1553 domain-containing protein [Verrucomicrobiales bacterium]|nr:DUF1553 domain-containing protein [Verrucomicrobiales bacterium]